MSSISFEKKIAEAFNLKDERWLKHANPWSIWTRFATLPFLVVAIWSRAWIGWFCLIPIAILIIWLFVNPTLFKAPKHLNHWGSKAVLGEKLWSERKTNPVPKHHYTPIHILTILQTLGSILLVIGLWNFHLYLTILGASIVYMAKMWFLDRMVWVFENMKNQHIE
ncbi:conserved hypothetical protein [Formosa agariphila KMM 3901]|uniref:Uncharacterized protein n=1 Tax=Formosa agariphila (strain DSM 15362 / KCTC 12365 / LMG 23005 / KMM 3901 / M-2Alg 35-1) TaxID=1347342 RepID=T2KLN8_FORAG|nr:DUF6653 family protein [Formosa agariphila]CDF79336.1 conserved hypothetical protein [Formosa agariphila KMM 3901]